LVAVGIAAGIAVIPAVLARLGVSVGAGLFGYAPYADARRSGAAVGMDSALQAAVQKALERQLQAAQLASGTAAVMEVKSGKVLALVGWPSGGDAAAEAVPMGSTVKPLTVLVGLREGLLRREDHFDDEGTYQYEGQTVSNQDGAANGDLTASLAIEMSSNTFMAAKVAVPLYNKYRQQPGAAVRIWEMYLQSFGLGRPADFDAEAARKGDLSALVNASWGQNEKFGVLDLVQYTATLANRGTRMKPLFDSRDKPVVLGRSDFSAADWDLVREGMSARVDALDALPVAVARKTGTSTEQKDGNTLINSLCIAYAPADAPTVAVAVVVPGGGLGSGIASKVAADALRFALSAGAGGG
jgi:cell division protein FtsI/penicillin-binding protein 2